MKKWLPLSLIVLPYLCLGASVWLFAWRGALDAQYLPLAVLAAGGTAPNVAYAAALSSRPTMQPELPTWARRIKLGHAPFYLLTFVLCIAMAVTVVGLLLLPLLLAMLYAALLPASLFALAALRFARRGGALDGRQARIRAVQLFIPGLDIIAALDICAKAADARGED